MNAVLRILWLEGIFDEDTVSAFPACSPAVNFWHSGFVSGLVAAGCNMTLVGHAYDRMWPTGRMMVRSGDARLAPGLAGKIAGYLNLPLLRRQTQAFNYMSLVKAIVTESGPPDYVFTFNDTPATSAARYLSRKYGVPWIYIAGDGPALKGANGYLYQNWVYYLSPSAPGPKIHLDGGLPAVGDIDLASATEMPKVLMYMGALTEHGGALQLARAFHSISEPDVELWFTGRGTNPALEQLAAVDPRIKLYGFVTQDKLHELAMRANFFANPRPTAFVPNKLNYPSKILHYLAYGRPVLSTFTDGLSPDYRDVLIPIEEETEAGLATAIRCALGLSDDEYRTWCTRVAQFNRTRTWSEQSSRLLSWLEAEFQGSPRPHKLQRTGE